MFYRFLRIVCFFCSNKTSEVSLEMLQDAFKKLGKFNYLLTVIVGSTLVKKLHHWKYLALTIDRRLEFPTQIKKTLTHGKLSMKQLNCLAKVPDWSPAHLLLRTTEESPEVICFVFLQNYIQFALSRNGYKPGHI